MAVYRRFGGSYHHALVFGHNDLIPSSFTYFQKNTDFPLSPAKMALKIAI